MEQQYAGPAPWAWRGSTFSARKRLPPTLPGIEEFDRGVQELAEINRIWGPTRRDAFLEEPRTPLDHPSKELGEPLLVNYDYDGINGISPPESLRSNSTDSNISHHLMGEAGNFGDVSQSPYCSSLDGQYYHGPTKRDSVVIDPNLHHLSLQQRVAIDQPKEERQMQKVTTRAGHPHEPLDLVSRTRQSPALRDEARYQPGVPGARAARNSSPAQVPPMTSPRQSSRGVGDKKADDASGKDDANSPFKVTKATVSSPVRCAKSFRVHKLDDVRLKYEGGATLRGGRKIRGNLPPERRKETAKTRSIGACVRCFYQKKRCEMDRSDPDGPCFGCRQTDSGSKKTIHRFQCIRRRLIDATLLPDLPLGDVDNCVDPDAFPSAQTTCITNKSPVARRVAMFQSQLRANPGNVSIDGKWQARGPRCLASVESVLSSATDDMLEYAKSYIMVYIDGLSDYDDNENKIPNVIKLHLRAFWDQYNGLAEKTTYTQSDSKEMTLLENAMILWVGIRSISGSFWTCPRDHLDAVTDSSGRPLYCKTPSQKWPEHGFDRARQGPWVNFRRNLMQGIESFFQRHNDRSRWFTPYVILFIFLHTASEMDHWNRATRGDGFRFDKQAREFIEGLAHGCNLMLCHWHYYDWETWGDGPETMDPEHKLFNMATEKQRELLLTTLTHPTIRSLRRSFEAEAALYQDGSEHFCHGLQRLMEYQEKDRAGRLHQFQADESSILREIEKMASPYYWIPQLFQNNWSPRSIYNRLALVEIG